MENALLHLCYAHKPNKEFCTSVAKKMVKKYPFMKDVGSGVSGFVSFLC